MRGVTVADLARVEGVTPRAISKRVAEGRLAAIAVPGPGRGGRRLLIPEAALDERTLARCVKKDLLRDADPARRPDGLPGENENPAPAPPPSDKELSDATGLALLEREPIAVDDLPAGTFLTSVQIADLLGCDRRAVDLKAAREGWPSLAVAGDETDGRYKRRLFPFAVLPADAQARWLEQERLDLSNDPDRAATDAQKDVARRYLALPAAARREALRRARIVELAEAASCRAKRRRAGLAAFVARWRAEHPEDARLSVRSIYRWRAAFARDGLLGLVPDWESRELMGRASLTPEMRAFLDLLYLDPNQPGIAWCCRRLVEKCRERGWPAPNYSAVRRYLQGIPEAERTFHRRGARAWEEKFLPSVLRDYDSVEPNEIWCADHHQVDVAVVAVDKNGNRRPLFPWLTAIQDIRTRAIVGWAVDETPSGATINLALLRALKRFGVPRHILLDNGRDFAGKRFTGGADHRFRFKVKEAEVRGVYSLLRIETHFCIPANAQAKPVERFFGTLERDFGVALPGYRGSSVAARPEQLERQLRAGDELLTLAAFDAELGGWLETFNAAWKHGGLGGRAPLDVWRAWFETHAVRQVEETTLRLIMTVAARRQVRRYGVQFENAWYWNDDLLRLHGQEVTLRYDPDDMMRVFVYDARDQFVCVAPLRDRAAFLGGMEEYKKTRTLRKNTKAAFRALVKARAEEAGGAPTLQDRLGSRVALPAAPAEEAPLTQLMETPLDDAAAAVEELAHPTPPAPEEESAALDVDNALAAIAAKGFTLEEDGFTSEVI